MLDSFCAQLYEINVCEGKAPNYSRDEIIDWNKKKHMIKEYTGAVTRCETE